jgi:hypothetical protein
VVDSRIAGARIAADMLAFSKFWYYVRRMQNRSFCVLERIRSLAFGSLSIGSGPVAYRSGQIVLAELVEGFLDAPRGRGCDALVEGEGLFQAGGGLAHPAL